MRFSLRLPCNNPYGFSIIEDLTSVSQQQNALILKFENEDNDMLSYIENKWKLINGDIDIPYQGRLYTCNVQKIVRNDFELLVVLTIIKREYHVGNYN